MLIDLHMHESTCSKDSFLKLERIVELAKEKGLDAICITDHDSMGLKEFAEDCSKKIGFPIFVGVEYLSLQGDITAWGIDSFPEKRIEAQKFIDLVNEQNGFCVACHPFRNNNRGLEENLKTVKGLGGIEVLNGSTDMEANRKALKYCKELGLQMVGASDSHWEYAVGKYVTWIPEDVTTLEDFIRVMKSKKSKPAIWKEDHYEVVDEF
ncbi:MAG: PHP domain-containing protein [Clostridium sp.]|uniref:PHP domain-containing protein n=1 Tax=Clostridium sp. TaxID=1506 RepID=UPI0029117D3A|nr:PHP domain-containing protein [Clostridium sp.]